MKKAFRLFTAVLFAGAVLAGCSLDQNNAADNKEKTQEDGEVKIGLSISTLNNPFFVTLKEELKKLQKTKRLS